MKVRTRLAVLLALALLVAGSTVALISALTYQQSVYSDPTSLGDELLSSLGVTRQEAIEYIRVHPESVFDPQARAGGSKEQQKVADAFRQIQVREQRHAVSRARWWTLASVMILSIVTGVIGWFIAGRMLRPIRLITARARSASASNLSNRVALEGPDDELKQLADTFDAMLERLEHSFVAQRHFSAQVSHELRSPLAVVRSEVELLLPDVHDEGEVSSLVSIRDAGLRAERLVTALLVLARSESGNLRHERVALDEVVGAVLGHLVESDDFRTLKVDVELHSVQVIGDVSLLESLVRNLVDNAARHNYPGGWLRIRVQSEEDGSIGKGLLEVENSTDSVSSGTDAEFTKTEPNTGHQVGRTVVQSIVDAHDGTVEWESVRPGVVVARVTLPLVDRSADRQGTPDVLPHSTEDAASTASHPLQRWA